MKGLKYALTGAAMVALSQPLQSMASGSFAASATPSPTEVEGTSPLTKADLQKIIIFGQKKGFDQKIPQIWTLLLGLSKGGEIRVLHQLLIQATGGKLAFYPLNRNEDGYLFATVTNMGIHLIRVDANLQLVIALVEKPDKHLIIMPLADAQQYLQETLTDWAKIAAKINITDAPKP